MSEFEREARDLARAAGGTVIVGVRGHNDSWFIHWTGDTGESVEYDCAGPLSGVRDLGRALARRFDSTARDAAMTADRLNARRVALLDLTDQLDRR